ncbi:MAG: hypothetical protein IPN29_15975 [Saprospiraceae bacterium]|nr:hypothetical protein [Saprospiraceae bacterium]
MSWFAFVAGGGNYTMVIEPFACAGGQNGAQFGIYEDCTFTNSIYCQSQPCVTGPQYLPSTLFTPGQVYFLWMDGCAASVCSYDIEIQGDFQQYQVPEIVDIECSSSIGRCDTICPNNTITFDARQDYDNLTSKFDWRVVKPSGTEVFITTADRFLEYTFTERGDYTVELNNIDVKCSLPIQPYAINVVVVDSLSGFCSSSDTCHVTVFDTIYTTIIDTNFIDVPRFISVTDTLIINLNVPNSSNDLVINKISIYPNPSNSHIFIDMGTYTLLKNYELQILNALGQPVYFTPIEQQLYYIDLNQWGEGNLFCSHKK